MFIKKIMLACLFILCILTISGVAAGEVVNGSSDLATDDFSMDYELNELNEDNLLGQSASGDEKSNLNNEIISISNEDCLGKIESQVSKMDLSYLDSNANTVSSNSYVTISQSGTNNQLIVVKMKTAFTGSIAFKYDTYNYLTGKSLDYSDSEVGFGFEDYFYKNEGMRTFTYDLSSWDPGLVYMTVKKDSNPFAYVNFRITKGISAPDVVKNYGGDEKFLVKVFDDNNKPIKGEAVAVFLNGKQFNIKTDSSGIASVNLNLNPGEYDVITVQNKNTVSSKVKVISSTKTTVSDSNSNNVAKVIKTTPKLTVNAKTFKVADKTKKYTVTLKTNQNKVMKNTKITLKVNGKTYTAKTNSKGQATFKLTKLTKKGTYTAVVKVAGDKKYNAVSKKAKITVKQPVKKYKSVTLKVIYSSYPVYKRLSNGDVISTNYEKFSGRQFYPGVYALASNGLGLVNAKYIKLVKAKVWFKNSRGKIITKSSSKVQYNWYIKVGLTKGYTPYKAQIWYK